MPSTISPIQELYLQLIAQSSFNDFDGKRVVADLRSHPEVWTSALMHDNYEGQITLRDLPENYNNVSILFVCIPQEQEEAFRQLADIWNPDELGTIDPFGWGYQTRTSLVYRLWWD